MRTEIGYRKKIKVAHRVMVVRGDILGLGSNLLLVSVLDASTGKSTTVDWRDETKTAQRLHGMGLPSHIAHYLAAELAEFMEKAIWQRAKHEEHDAPQQNKTINL